MINLKKSYKNLRWDEGYYLFCKRNNLDLTYDEFEEEYRRGSGKVLGASLIDDNEFESILIYLRKLTVRLSKMTSNEEILNSLNEEELDLLHKFGNDEFKSYFRENRLGEILDKGNNETI